eukprot:7610085-Alexandrium_andersonii.AAC.1
MWYLDKPKSHKPQLPGRSPVIRHSHPSAPPPGTPHFRGNAPRKNTRSFVQDRGASKGGSSVPPRACACLCVPVRVRVH